MPDHHVQVSLDSVADISKQPTSKGIVVRLEPDRPSDRRPPRERHASVNRSDRPRASSVTT
ncbi:hypothetical protein EF915_04860 [Streptomyces sp. WAC08401]|nr:hypothetical protein EF915_04860 [Streptomyces sp. WAC08401]